MFVRKPLERLVSAYRARLIRQVGRVAEMTKIAKVILMRRKFLNSTYRG